MSVFSTLNTVDCSEHIERKNGLSYLSWAWAWAEVKKRYPEAVYTIYENGDGWIYHTDGKTAWVKTGVTIDGIEHIEYLPVMDFKNKSIPVDSLTSFDVNKAIQRSLTKACARHGLGLYIYAGEDLPEQEKEEKQPDPENIKLLRAIIDGLGKKLNDEDGLKTAAFAEALAIKNNFVHRNIAEMDESELSRLKIALAKKVDQQCEER